MKRVLICGSRNYIHQDRIESFIKTLYDDDVVIHGGAKGADQMAGQAAKAQGLEVIECKPDWNLYGRAAGPIRNSTMLNEKKPDYVIYFTEDLSVSKGTKDMVSKALKKKNIIIYDGHNSKFLRSPFDVKPEV